MKIGIAIATMLLLAGAVGAQASEKEIMEAETAWARAIEKVDAAALDRVLADDLVYAHSTGVVDTKQAYIKSMQSGTQKYASVQTIDPKIRIYGDTAIVNSKVRMTGASKGQAFDNQLLMIHVWLKRQNRWQLVAHQTTRIP